MHAGNLLHKRAQLTPHREALVEITTGQRFTFADLSGRVKRTVAFLIQQGVTKGDRIAILAYNNVAFVDMLYACLQIGAVFTPLNWRLAANELSYIINNCDPFLIIHDEAFATLFNEAKPHIHVPHLISLTDYMAETAVISPSNYADDTLSAEDLACILYTSGTTGKPKGAMIPHRQILWNCINTAISWELTANDISPIFTPMFHAGGLFVFLTPLFYVGGKIILTQQFDPLDSLKVMEEERVTAVLGVPTLYQVWLNHEALAQTDLSHMRWFISGGAPCPVPLIQQWEETTGIPLRQGYGLTEVGTNCFTMTNEEALTKAGSVGKPIFHSQMRLIKADGQLAQTGETGELQIKGLHVSAGYWCNTEATTQSLKQGWFCTGDMAQQDADGYYYIVGRFKDMLISGGENVYSAEVEGVLLQHPAVAECALIPQPDPKWGEVGLMVIVLQKNCTVTKEELREFCRQSLAKYKIPKHIVFTNKLPYSPYGKVIKAKLKEQFL